MIGFLQDLVPHLPRQPFVPLYVGFASSLYHRLGKHHETITKHVNGRNGVLFYAFSLACAAEAAYVEVALIQYLNPILNTQLAGGAPVALQSSVFADPDCAVGPAYYSGEFGFDFSAWSSRFSGLALDRPGVYFAWQTMSDFCDAVDGGRASVGDKKALVRIRRAARRKTEIMYPGLDLAALYKPAASALARARELEDIGLSYDQIAGRLTLEGYGAQRGAKCWSGKAIRNMLQLATAETEPTLFDKLEQLS